MAHASPERRYERNMDFMQENAADCFVYYCFETQSLIFACHQFWGAELTISMLLIMHIS